MRGPPLLLILTPLLVASGGTPPSSSANPVQFSKLVSTYDPTSVECPAPLPAATRVVGGIDAYGLVDSAAAAEKVLGVAKPHGNGGGEAAHYDYTQWRCWVAANGDGTVLVNVGTELSADLKVLGAEVPFRGRSQCTKTPLVNRAMATANGVHLGMTRAEVEAIVGPAVRSGDGWFERACFSRVIDPPSRPGGKASDHNVDASFVGVTVKDKLVGFRVTWFEG